MCFGVGCMFAKNINMTHSVFHRVLRYLCMELMAPTELVFTSVVLQLPVVCLTSLLGSTSFPLKSSTRSFDISHHCIH